jgi:hypothetical protein
MIKHRFYNVFLLLILNTNFLGVIVCKGQQHEHRSFDPITCYSGNRKIVGKEHRFLKELRRSYAIQEIDSSNRAVFEVTYNSAYPDSAKAAMEHALDIWDSYLNSTQPIKIFASWEDRGFGVLASAGPTEISKNFQAAPKSETWYAIPIAEKIARQELNDPEDFEINTIINNRERWYTGIDANPGPGEFDLVMVILHEIAHGLGFIDLLNYNSSNTEGNYTFGQPSSFDRYLVTGRGELVVDTTQFPDFSLELGALLTSQNIFHSSTTADFLSGGRIRMFAPSIFLDGSSISHTDEDTYDPGGEDALMTPRIDAQEAVHEPGNALSILRAIGWWHTSMFHQFYESQETDTINPYPIDLEVFTDVGFDTSTLELVYSFEGQEWKSSAISLDSGNQFSGILPQEGSGIYSYYFTAVETTGNRVTLPGSSPTFAHTAFLGIDTIKPSVSYTNDLPGILLVEEGRNYEFTTLAGADDNLGLEEVATVFGINGLSTEKTMPFVRENLYSTVIDVNFPDDVGSGDLLKHEIRAKDIAKSQNLSIANNETYETILAVPNAPITKLYTDFETESAKELFVNYRFEISSIDSLETTMLKSETFYPVGDNSLRESNYIAILESPIIINADTSNLDFDEIVLVQPGENLTEFGEAGFNDYVIVEAKKLGNHEWKPLENGYDARYYFETNRAYNRAIDSVGNSTYTPGKADFKNHSFDLKDTFEAGDTIVLRFRLFSDEKQTGWGWAIDNLRIQTKREFNLVNNPPLSSIGQLKNLVSVFPNPFSNQIKLLLRDTKGTARITLTNTLGQSMLTSELSGNNLNLDTRQLSAGVYYLTIEAGSENLTLQLVKK